MAVHWQAAENLHHSAERQQALGRQRHVPLEKATWTAMVSLPGTSPCPSAASTAAPERLAAASEAQLAYPHLKALRFRQELSELAVVLCMLSTVFLKPESHSVCEEACGTAALEPLPSVEIVGTVTALGFFARVTAMMSAMRATANVEEKQALNAAC